MRHNRDASECFKYGARPRASKKNSRDVEAPGEFERADVCVPRDKLWDLTARDCGRCSGGLVNKGRATGGSRLGGPP